MTLPFFVKLGIIKPVGSEVDKSIEIVNNLNSSSKIDTIKIGDSVGKQLNPEQGIKNGSLNICNNQAISILGHAMLTQKVLNSTKNSDIILIGFFRPSSLYNSLNQEWTNNYFIKKFYNQAFLFNKNLISSKTTYEIDSIFLYTYKKYSWLFKNTTLNQYSPFMAGPIGKNSNSIQNVKLIEFLLKTELRTLLLNIQFQSMPISSKYYNDEKKYTLKLKRLGINIKHPILVEDKYFVEDNIHLKPLFFVDKKSLYN
jgi:hypothetical protein